MTSQEALKLLRKTYPELNSTDLPAMFDAEYKAECVRRGSTSKYDVPSVVMERMKDWIEHADEHWISDLPSFVANTRVTCVWCVLVGKQIKRKG